MAPSPQHGTRVRASSAAARKAARSAGDNGPARREISASGSRSLIMDIDGLAWNKLAVFRQCDCQELGPLPGGPLFVGRTSIPAQLMGMLAASAPVRPGMVGPSGNFMPPGSDKAQTTRIPRSKICGLWMRLSCKDVGDLIAGRQTHGRPR